MRQDRADEQKRQLSGRLPASSMRPPVSPMAMSLS